MDGGLKGWKGDLIEWLGGLNDGIGGLYDGIGGLPIYIFLFYLFIPGDRF